MAQFTRIDRNLLVRIAQQLRDEAEIVRKINEPWTHDRESLKQKARFERLLRDSTDIDNLRRRMEKEFPDMTKAPSPAEAGTNG